MRYNYKGFRGCDSRCDIEVQRRNDDKYVFVATEVPDNPGTSSSHTWDTVSLIRAVPHCRGQPNGYPLRVPAFRMEVAAAKMRAALWLGISFSVLRKC